MKTFSTQLKTQNPSHNVVKLTVFKKKSSIMHQNYKQKNWSDEKVQRVVFLKQRRESQRFYHHA